MSELQVEVYDAEIATMRASSRNNLHHFVVEAVVADGRSRHVAICWVAPA